MTEFNEIYTVKKELTDDQFLRALLIELATDKHSPNDICTANFGEIRESTREVMVCAAHVELDYSASVGYDRKEEYYEKEKKYDPKLGTDVMVDVKKTRTVTDWHPHSGHTSGDSVCAAFNDDESQSPQDSNRIANILRSVDKDNIDRTGEAEVNAEGLKAVKNNCMCAIKQKIKYPGDHIRSVNETGTATINKLSCYKLPYYRVDFNYNGEDYHASGFACGKPNAETQRPKNNVDINAAAREKVKPLKRGLIACLAACGVSFVLAIVLGMFDIAAWTWAFVPVTLVAAVILWVIGNKKYNSIKYEMTKKNNMLKLDDLKRALSNKRLPSLTDEETAVFNTL